MHQLICISIPTLMILDMLRLQLSLPKPALLLPELLAGIALLMALRSFASTRQLMITPGFALWFAIMLLFLTFGLVAAEATTGPTVGGIRFYLKYLPFFLIPIVYRFSESQLRFQLQLILGFCLVQAPISMAQRFITEFGGLSSGDAARGTFATGSMAAVFLLMALAVLIACYHKKIVSRLQLAIYGGLMFIPLTIGEIKGAFILLPLVLIIPAIMTPDGKPVAKKLMRGAIPTMAVLALFATVYGLVESNFRPIPKHGEVEQSEHRTSLVAFFTDPKKLMHYMAPRLQSEDGEHKQSGRIDDLVSAFVTHSDEPIRLIVGLGIGAVTEAPIEAFSSDQHIRLIEEGVVGTSMSILLWEMGLLGLLLISIGGYMVWSSAKISRHDPGLAGAIGLAWLAVVPLIFIALFWKDFLSNDPISAVFAYFTGHVLASAYRQRNFRERAPIANGPNSLDSVLVQSDGIPPPILQTASAPNGAARS